MQVRASKAEGMGAATTSQRNAKGAQIPSKHHATARRHGVGQSIKHPADTAAQALQESSTEGMRTTASKYQTGVEGMGARARMSVFNRPREPTTPGRRRQDPHYVENMVKYGRAGPPKKHEGQESKDRGGNAGLGHGGGIDAAPLPNQVQDASQREQEVCHQSNNFFSR